MSSVPAVGEVSTASWFSCVARQIVLSSRKFSRAPASLSRSAMACRTMRSISRVSEASIVVWVDGADARQVARGVEAGGQRAGRQELREAVGGSRPRMTSQTSAACLAVGDHDVAPAARRDQRTARARLLVPHEAVISVVKPSFT